MEEDADLIDEMEARLDAQRLIIAVMARHLPDRSQLLDDLLKLEEMSRKSNLRTATIEEIATLRDVLEGL